MLTFHEVCDKLRQLDEVTLLEELDISSEDIVAKFANRIEKRIEYYSEMFEDDDRTMGFEVTDE